MTNNLVGAAELLLPGKRESYLFMYLFMEQDGYFRQ